MNDQIEQELTESAVRRFGEARTAELAGEIVKLAEELRAIRQYPISIADEP